MTVRDHLAILITSAILAASLSFNVFLAWRLSARPPHSVRAAGFQRGELLPPFSVTTVDGAVSELSLDGRTIVYVFSPTCEWCARDYPNLHAIHNTVGDQYDFVAITRVSAGVSDYLRQFSFPGRVLVVDSSNLSEELAHDLAYTPQLLVVDADRTVKRAWAGALLGSRKYEAEEFFEVQLPGVGSSQ